MADDPAANVPAPGRKSASRELTGIDKREKSWFVPLIAALILASSFCLYYFVYVAAQRDYLANRNFRSLAVLGTQIQEMISIHSSTLEYAAELAAPQKKNAHREKNNLSQFLVVRDEDKHLRKEDQEKETQKDYLNYLAPSFELTEIPGATGPGSTVKSERFETRRRNGRWELVLTTRSHAGVAYDLAGALDIDGMLQPLVGSLPFDDIMLVSENGTVVYQHNRAGPQFTTLTGLLQAQANMPEAATAGVAQNANRALLDKSKHLTDVDLAGTHYKLFLQPILLDVFSDERGQSESAHEWVVCGLQSAKALEWEALSISSTFVIWFTVLFLAICLSGPVLKVIFMNGRERFHLRELGFLALFLVLLTGVLTLAGIEAVIFPRNDNTETQLNAIGDKLAGNIHWELQLMRDQLQKWCGDEFNHELNHDLKLAVGNEVVRNTPDDVPETPATVTPDAHAYPYFTNAFWTDDDGHQVVKWSATAYSTPMIDVSKLRLFAHAKTTYLDGQGPPFYFDSVRPPNKLEYLAGMSISTLDCPASALAGVRGDISGGSAFLTTQSLSLIDPILPSGYGFALLDETGSVLFHNDKTRNVHENFLEESDGSKQLYAAAFGHSAERFLNIKYLGKDYRARITPVPGVSQAAWSLIVYRDLTPVRTLNLQAMTMTSSLFLMILAGPVIVIAIWCAISRPRFAPEWLWPNQGRARTYVYQIFIYAALIVLFLLPGFRGSIEQNVIACFLFTYAALLLTFWCYRAFPPAPGKPPELRWRQWGTAGAMASLTGFIFFIPAFFRQWSRVHVLTYVLSLGIIVALPVLEQPRQYLATAWKHSFRLAATPVGNPSDAWKSYYVVSIILLLLLVGVSIPMALFRVSMNVERRLSVKQAQLHLASALGQRVISIREQCEKGELAKGACDQFRYPGSDIWKRIVLDPLLPGGDGLPVRPHNPGAGGRELYSPWFRDLIYSLHHDYNKVAAEMLGVIPDRAHAEADNQVPDWAWQNDETGTTLRWHGIHLLTWPGCSRSPHTPEEDLVIPPPPPVQSRMDSLPEAAVAAGVILGIGLLVWTLVPKIFLFHVAPVPMTAARRATEFIRAGGNAVILLPPGSEWSVDAKKWTVDLREVAIAPDWAEAFDLNKLPLNTLIEIRHFEYNTSDAAIDNQKFTLLERLLKQESTQVAVMLTVPASAEDYRRLFRAFELIDLRDDSSYWLKHYEGPARDLIWKECGPLAALWPLGVQLAKDIKPGDAHSGETVAAEMLERADPYYRLIWKESSPDQKFALAQLAADGLLNPTNGRAVRQLVSRGLITGNPQFRIMNESFRCFLLSHTTPDLKREWLRESRRSGWGKIHGAFFTTMLILGAFLLTTQNQLWQSSAAYVTTGLGALGTLAKLFNTYRGGGSADKVG